MSEIDPDDITPENPEDEDNEEDEGVVPKDK